MAFDRDRMKEKAAALAAKGVYIGTSSWKYQGWFGQLYTPGRYEYRGKVAKTRFERDCLAKHGVTHIFNSWDAMPPVGEQMTLPGSRTNPNLVAARFLLKPGRKYEEAVRTFQPYDKVKEENSDARTAGKALIAESEKNGSGRETFIYVNNRLEGNALATIDAML